MQAKYVKQIKKFALYERALCWSNGLPQQGNLFARWIGTAASPVLVPLGYEAQCESKGA
jgi:hypothetical protein